jgi:hypothetical protein
VLDLTDTQRMLGYIIVALLLGALTGWRVIPEARAWLVYFRVAILAQLIPVGSARAEVQPNSILNYVAVAKRPSVNDEMPARAEPGSNHDSHRLHRCAK